MAAASASAPAGRGGVADLFKVKIDGFGGDDGADEVVLPAGVDGAGDGDAVGEGDAAGEGDGVAEGDVDADVADDGIVGADAVGGAVVGTVDGGGVVGADAASSACCRS